DCYAVGVSGDRPAPHWDAEFQETLQGFDGGHTWVIHIGDSFTDVPRSHPFYKVVETMLHRGVTSGCGSGNYCPGNTVSRAQMAPVLLRALEGPEYTPPACEGVFSDVVCP